MHKEESMFDRKTIIYAVISVLLVVATIITACFIFPIKKVIKEESKFSKHEILTVTTERTDVSYFSGIDFIGKSKEELTGKIKNVTLVTDNLITSNNIKCYGVNGSLEIILNNNTVQSVEFRSIPLKSASDVDVVFRKISEQIAIENNKPEESITLILEDFSEKPYESPSELYNLNNRLRCLYNINGIAKLIYTEASNGNYYIVVSTS